MREVQATVVKARLSELLRDVERGESITITRNGKKVAALVPIEDEEREQRRKSRGPFHGDAAEAGGQRASPLRSLWTGATRDTDIEFARHRRVCCRGMAIRRRATYWSKCPTSQTYTMASFSFHSTGILKCATRYS